MFRPLFFFLGIIVGVFLVYTIKPNMTTVTKYPHPDTVNAVTYKDKNGICYKYVADKVKCTGDSSEVPYPVQ